MPNVFVSHTGEDSKRAVHLADLLEARGHSTWYFERDSLPGISYLLQCQEAIRECKSLLVVLSRAAIQSHEIARELELAHRLNRMIVPILIDIDLPEIAQYQPSWEMMIGAAVSISLNENEISQVASRVVKSLEFNEIAEDRPKEQKSKDASSDHASSYGSRRGILWASDANQIDIGDLKSVVFENQLLSDFLRHREKYFLSANKGLGKTLLLTFKRSLLSDATTSKRANESSVHFVPVGRPYLDFMGDLRTLGESHEQFFQTLGNAKRVWGLALRMSALSFHQDLIDVKELEQIKSIPKSFYSWLSGGKVEPTIAFKELCGLTIRNLNRLLDESDNYFERRLRQIHGAMYFFVDKVDQALRSVSRETWIHVQAGLLEAAWDEMNANSHLKIYASIREEAFANYESPLKTNLYGALTSIEYSETDLRELLDSLARYYENGKSFAELTRLNVVRHPHRAFPEDAFSYLRRHTFGRPRDMVIIASEISSRQHELNEPLFREIVSDTSAAVLVPNVFEEMSVFLKSLSDKNERLRFLSLLPQNILREDEMIEICCRFNGIDTDSFDFYGDNADAIFHPFSELHRVGLLGWVIENNDGTGADQYFRQPSDVLLDAPVGLPDAPYYLIHPALDRYVLRNRLAGKYRVFQHILVGHQQPWRDHFDQIWNAERTMFRIKEQETKSLCHRLIKECAIQIGSGMQQLTSSPDHEQTSLRDTLETSLVWKKLLELRTKNDAIDEFVLWIDELVEKQET